MKLLITLPCLALSTPIHFKLKFKPIWNGMATQTYSLKDKSNWAIHIDAVQEFTATSNALLEKVLTSDQVKAYTNLPLMLVLVLTACTP